MLKLILIIYLTRVLALPIPTSSSLSQAPAQTQIQWGTVTFQDGRELLSTSADIEGKPIHPPIFKG
jgi:hypothetical protein